MRTGYMISNIALIVLDFSQWPLEALQHKHPMGETGIFPIDCNANING